MKRGELTEGGRQAVRYRAQDDRHDPHVEERLGLLRISAWPRIAKEARAVRAPWTDPRHLLLVAAWSLAACIAAFGLGDLPKLLLELKCGRPIVAQSQVRLLRIGI